MVKVKSTNRGIFIPKRMVNIPAGTEFSVRTSKYAITLEPENLTEKTSGLVKVKKIDIDEEIGRMAESRVVE